MQSKLNQSNVQNQIEKQNGYSPIDVTLTAIYRLGGKKMNRPAPSGERNQTVRHPAGRKLQPLVHYSEDPFSTRKQPECRPLWIYLPK